MESSLGRAQLRLEQAEFARMFMKAYRFFAKKRVDDPENEAAEVFRKLVEELSRDPERIGRRNEPTLEQKLMRLATSHAENLKVLKMANAKLIDVHDKDLRLLGDERVSFNEATGAEIHEAIAYDTAIGGLPPPQRDAVRLNDAGYMDHEAAEMMGTTLWSFKSHLKRARLNIGRALGIRKRIRQRTQKRGESTSSDKSDS